MVQGASASGMTRPEHTGRDFQRRAFLGRHLKNGIANSRGGSRRSYPLRVQVHNKAAGSCPAWRAKNAQRIPGGSMVKDIHAARPTALRNLSRRGGPSRCISAPNNPARRRGKNRRVCHPAGTPLPSRWPSSGHPILVAARQGLQRPLATGAAHIDICLLSLPDARATFCTSHPTPQKPAAPPSLSLRPTRSSA